MATAENTQGANKELQQTRIQQVTVDEVDVDGKYVLLRNEGDEDQNLGNWQVKRQVGSSAPIAFKFPAEFILKVGQRVTIWAAGAGGNHNPPSDLVWETQANWGTGDQFQTTLINTNGEQVAHSTCGDSEVQLCAAPADSPRTSPTTAAPYLQLPAPTVLVASQRVCRLIPTCSVVVHFARQKQARAMATTENTQAANKELQQTRIQQVTVDEVDLDGKYIRLRNEGDEDQNLGNWQVKRQVGSSAPIAFKFPAEFILKPGQRVTIWAAGAGGNHNPPSDLVWETQANWGTGDQFQTTLINTNGEEKAISKASHTFGR
ncbi:uncharacterized protein ACBT44_001199 [Syngnathus typhle]